MRKYVILLTPFVYRLVIEVILGVIIVVCMLIEMFIAFFAAIDFKSLEKAQ